MNETSGATLLDSTPHERKVGLGGRTVAAAGRIGAGTGGELSGQFVGPFTMSWWIKPAAYDGWLVGGNYYFGVQLRPDGTIGLGTPVGVPLGPQQSMTEYLSETDRLLEYGRQQTASSGE
ncbi:MAG: hypothetical protein ACKOHK_15655 [Planctomycetia bacterium]